MSDSIIEPLEKKCPRCGGKSANPSNPSGRCKACLKKLAAAKKKPGSWQRAQTKADDALRRQKGKNGTAHKKSKGLGSRASIVKQVKSAERKTGEKLSPDRKNNSEGYAAKNTRMVPEKLNRGRHHVDAKKLAAWRKKLKKHDLDTATLFTLLKAKAYETNNAKLIKSLGLDGLEELLKEAAMKLPEPAAPTNELDNHVGTTHTVEIHPDMDHLYRAKSFITQSGQPHLHIGDFKHAGFNQGIVKKLPRDANGKVSADMIDDHIAKLPKQKVNITVAPYTWGAQQHRKGPQFALQVKPHEDTLKNMPHEHRGAWEMLRNCQHLLNPNGVGQFGWARIDSNSKPGHWHIDELQSDFQHKDKITEKAKTEVMSPYDAQGYDISNYINKYNDGNPFVSGLTMKENSESNKDPAFKPMREALRKLNDAKQAISESPHDEKLRDAYHRAHDALTNTATKHGITKDAEDFKDYINLIQNNPEKILHHLSHGHDDPQHAIHSAVNALARKLNIKSLSMDTPQDQARQSGLRSTGRESDVDAHFVREMTRLHPLLWADEEVMLRDGSHPGFSNPNFKSAFEKLGGIDALRAAADYGTGSGSSVDPESLFEAIDDTEGHYSANSNSLLKKYRTLSLPERDAVYDMLHDYDQHVRNNTDTYDHQKTFKLSDIPIHQIDTYHKRPKRLGMEIRPKAEVLGDDPSDNQKEVQYTPVHKSLQELAELLIKFNRSIKKSTK